MSLENFFEARLAGEQPDVRDEMADDLKQALAAQEALPFALGETILLPAPDVVDRAPPQLPLDYQIVRELGRGGMGVVYLARQQSLNRLVAVKVLRPGEMAFGPMVRRFLDEAKHLAKLRHPNLVSVHEVGEAGGEPYFSMDYIEGESLADLLRQIASPPHTATCAPADPVRDALLHFQEDPVESAALDVRGDSVRSALGDFPEISVSSDFWKRAGIPRGRKRRRLEFFRARREALSAKSGAHRKACVAPRSLSPSRALAILKQAAEGVAHAHQAGIIHRDLKPANILLDAAGRAYVTDFGLARNLTEESDRTHSGAVIGTPQYMSPEQARGETRLVGETTDVHALGAILYELLTGRPPYGSDNPMQVLMRLVHDEPVPPRRIDPRISRDLETICLKALVKQPAGRYATVGAMLEDIHRYETGQPLTARRRGLGLHAKQIGRRCAKFIAVALAAAAVALAIAPKLFDTSVAELIAWGDEEHAAKRESTAVAIYRHALPKASPAQRLQIVERLGRSVGEIEDQSEAVQVALEAIDEAPDASFGKHDQRVAQALLARLRARYPKWLATRSTNNGTLYADVPDEARPLLRLADRRLAIALKGPIATPAERKALEEMRALISTRLAHQPLVPAPAASMQPPMGLQAADLLRGTPTELLARAGDEDLPIVMRMEAAYKSGAGFSAAGDGQAALEAYSKGYSLRTMFPFYAVRVGDHDLTAGASEWLAARRLHASYLAPDQFRICQLLRDVYAARRPLANDPDPFGPDDLRGGLRLRFENTRLPRGGSCKINLSLTAPDVPAMKGSPAAVNFAGALVFYRQAMELPLQSEPIWLGVADGRYLLTCNIGLTVGPPNWRESLQLNLSDLPAEVEIHGQTVELPPIRLAVATEIKLVAPIAGASIDLAGETFRWSPVEGAVRYAIDLGIEYNEWAEIGIDIEAAPRARTKRQYLNGLSAASNHLRLVELPREDQNALSQLLKPGRTRFWTVSAYDAKNIRIAMTYGEGGRFFVASGLDNPIH